LYVQIVRLRLRIFHHVAPHREHVLLKNHDTSVASESIHAAEHICVRVHGNIRRIRDKFEQHCSHILSLW